LPPYIRLVPASAVPPRLPIIDSHHHVWDLSVRGQPWLRTDEVLAPLRRNFSVAELAPLAAAAGVTKTVVVQTVTEQAETAELVALALADPLVAAVVGWADLAAQDVADAIAELRAMPGGSFLAGIRHPLLTEASQDWLARPDVRRGLAAIAAAGLSFDLVLQPSQLPEAVQTAAELPHLTFVLDHLGNVEVDAQIDESWAAAFTAFAALPNTVCKLSGMLSVPAPLECRPARGGHDAPAAHPPRYEHLRPYFDLALDCFGPDRLMFGSDWPVCTLSAGYADVVSAAVELTGALSETEQAAILAGTARATYRIAGS
jgi:L-fuconolactonase